MSVVSGANQPKHSGRFLPHVTTTHLNLLTGHSTVPVVLQLVFDEHCADTKGQEHGPVPRRPAAEPAPEAGGLQLSCQALQGGAVVAVPSRQESLRLNGADRRACTEALTSELGCDSASRFQETQLYHRPTQLQPPANNVLYRHNLPGKVT